MITRRKLTYFLILLTLSGCAESLKSAWGDFTAYYNTYYNARNYLEKGIRQVDAVVVPVDLNHPIRVFPTPPNADPSDFQSALEKGAKVIREHPHSHWSDNALALVGESYFYQGHYYNAAKAFNDLYQVTENGQLRQEAVFWMGRIYLETGRYENGLQYLQDQMTADSIRWQPNHKRDILLLMTDLYVAQGNLIQARSILQKTIPQIDDRELKARAAYLNGQILEKTGHYQQAYRFYSLATALRPSFELLFASRLKMGINLRETGQFAQSLALFGQMLTDDKNVDRYSIITYEKAVTLKDMKKYDNARMAFETVLHDSRLKSPEYIRARSYYQLGELYREHYKDFLIADAMYDSASSINTNSGELPSSLNIHDLRLAFRSYAKLRRDIGNIDRLLWLGSMPVAKADSIIKAQNLEHKKQLTESRNQESNSLINVKAIDKKTETSDTGFLNTRDPGLENEAKAAFRAIWGNRPLTDNWRRSSAINMNPENTESGKAVNSRPVAVPSQHTVDRQSLAGIPFTEPQKEKLRFEKLNKQYELANVFFLQMNLADSAEYYYKIIIHQHLDSALIPKAIYSLVQLYQNTGLKSLERKWGDSLLYKYPQSVYSSKLQNDLNRDYSGDERATGSNKSTFSGMIAAYSDSTELAKAVAAAQWAYRHRDSATGAPALYFSAVHYIQAAKSDTTGRCTRTDNLDFVAKADTTLYDGPCWDQARLALRNLIDQYPGWSGKDKAQLLLQALEKEKE